MADKNLKIKLSAEDKLSPAVQKAVTNVGGLNTGMVNLSAALSIAGAVAHVAAKAYEAISHQMHRAIDEALEGEKANNRLAGAMVQSGTYTAELNEQLQKHVDMLEATTGANGETVKGMISTGLQMGLSIEKSKQLEQASRELAAANGIDVTQAFNAMQMATIGQMSQLQKYIPQVKELGKAQLKQGAAIDLVLKSTKAQYSLYQNSLPGAIDRVETASGNLYKAFGQILTQNPAIRNAVNALATGFGDFTEYVISNQSAISDFVTKGLKNFAIAASGVVSIFGENSMSKALDSYVTSIQEMEVHTSLATKSAKELEQQQLEGASSSAAAALLIQKYYNGFAIGTTKQREALTGEVEDRDNNLKNFNAYLKAKTRLAVSAAEEEKAEIAKVQAGAVAGSGGGEELNAQAKVAVNAEKNKQAELKFLRDKHLIDEVQFNEAMAASRDKIAQAELEQALAHRQALSNIMGDTDEGFEAKLQLEEERFQLTLQQRITQAEQEGATEEQILEMKGALYQNHLVDMASQREAFIQSDIAANEKLGNDWAVTLGKIRLEQQKHGKIVGTLRGVQQSEEYKGTQTALGNLSNLRISHSKHAFEVGQAAAIANATMNTFTAATAAYTAMAGIPIVGPALGAAAAAAAVASGFVNIQQISAQKFQPAGRAHAGLTEVPSNLDNKSFVLQGGERVVATNQNQDLKEFLSEQKAGKSANSPNYHITLNYSGAGGKGDAEDMAEIVIKEIRRRSEMGVTVVSSRGVS